MKIYIYGSVGSGKTLLANMFKSKAEEAGLSVTVSDHELHSWKDSFPSDLRKKTDEFDKSGVAVGIFVVNTGAETHIPVISFSEFITPDSFILR